MSDPLPDDAAFYTSPLSDAGLAAIGRLITAWASVETAMPMQVARLTASPAVGEEDSFAHTQFIRSAACLMGTALKAALTQLQNLAPARNDELKAAGDAIMNIKIKRDTVAHALSSPSAKDDKILFSGFAASRVKLGTDKLFSLEELQSWCDRLKQEARTIDAIVTDLTGWTWTRIREDQERYLKSLEAKGAQIPGILHH